jgi:N-ethylmaleimide reductase
MHCGRIGSHHNKAPGARTVAPSAVRAAGQIYTDAAGMADFDPPEALDIGEIPAVVDEYRHSAMAAMQAGFDGVELHCTSGYLPAQFLSTGTNRRNDAYGGSALNRARFVLEVLDALVDVAGASRIGMRICPGNPFNDLHDDDPEETFGVLLDAVAPREMAYLHVIRSPREGLDAFALARRHFPGPLVLNDGFDAESAGRAVATGDAAAVSFGRAYIANPDLVRRMREKLPLARFDPKTLYTPGARGYTDYPPAP